ncbi:hypothetical protein CSB45_12595 [candidate division KSB3 bacterium]|uniref:Arylamine N-acetyltransferase n=1 Tax=candidate division KSB3 bacterium TaxID=2044937 RepID=A0A2G6E2M6_9BACT|nr:MAG: hypothetical protein CSB45_12595 [candidate division KSB3 bacterium]PIE28731.1 MAG: hypothetical protein CSA57_12580 [candidate division KSB3 bacterium]
MQSETTLYFSHKSCADPHFSIQNPALLSNFLERFAIEPSRIGSTLLLKKLCTAFSSIPYENLTKIIKSDSVLSPVSAKRMPDEVLHDFLRYGCGGTCFSLTATCIALLNAFEFDAFPILADRSYGSDTHCALLFPQAGEFLLLDPGYLITTPVALPTTAAVTCSNGVNRFELVPEAGGTQVELYTLSQNSRRFRLSYKISPVDGPAFRRAWERSFAWEMMTFPVLTRYCQGAHYYLQGNTLRIRNAAGSRKEQLASAEDQALVSLNLGIDAAIMSRALSLL